MNGWIAEKMIIFAYSQRTQWATILGLISYFLVKIVGIYLLKDYQAPGIFRESTDVLREMLSSRYDRMAWAGLFAFWSLAAVYYKNDAKKFYNTL